MSKNINVNPGQYKVRGRERQGEDTVPAQSKIQLTKNRKSDVARGKKNKKR